MKFRLVHILIFALCTFCVGMTHGQVNNFRNYNSEDGLSNTTILSITQLENGELWLGTNEGGINIFDGNNFESITKENGLVDNVIYDFLHDKEGNIWVSTNNGVSVFDGNQFDSIPIHDTLVHTRVFKTFIDSENQTWFCTGEGLAQLQNGEMVKYQSSNDELNSTPIIFMSEDDQGNKWFGSMGASAFQMTPSGDIIKWEEGKEMKYTFYIFHPNPETTWFLTYKGLFELKNGQLSQKEFDSFKQYSSVYFHHCIEDKEGNYWFATKKRGVLKVSGNKEKLFAPSNGLIDENCWRVFQDRESNIWFGGKNKGLSILPNETFDLTNSSFGLPNDNVEALLTDSRGRLWVGTNDGIFLSDSSGHQTINDEVSNSRNDIRAIEEDLDGNIHILMKSGVKIISDTKTSVYNLNNEDQMFSGYCAYIDHENIIYGGVQGLGMKQGNYIVEINDSLQFPNTPVLDIERDNQGVYWFATDRGLLSHDGTSTTFYNESHGISSSKMRCIEKDQDGNLWIGSSEGIYVYINGEFKHITEENGLTNNTTYSLIFDHSGQLWVGQADGLDRLIIENFGIREVRHYDEGKGFMANFCNNSAIELDTRGKVLIGTDKGLLTYHKEFDQFNFLESVTEITDVKLFSQPTNWYKFSDKLDSRGYPIDLELGYNENYFTFDFTGICHRNPDAVQYKYMLKGLDRDWILTKDKKNAAYSNLKPGHYTFMVMSSNDEGIWNKEPATFSFTVLPPFWQTWWFYSLCFIAFAFAVYSYLKIRASNKKIKKSNARIVQQNEIIEEKNHEIVDSINYAKRIQEAILPKNQLKEDFENCFVFYRPKDIVSGDFYWYKKVDNKYLMAAVDCTGHGVPGGFVSMVGYSGLNRAVNEYGLRKPSDILEKLSEFVVESFEDDGGEDGIKDGMDAALCSIDIESRIVEFSGANNPLYVIRNNGEVIFAPDNQQLDLKNLDNLYEIKGDRRPVGASDNKKLFTNHQLQLNTGDTLYFFTDGYPDQFGGPKGKKFMYKSFKKLLISIASLSVDEQRNRIAEEFEKWKGDLEQVDDICVIGVKL